MAYFGCDKALLRILARKWWRCNYISPRVHVGKSGLWLVGQFAPKISTHPLNVRITTFFRLFSSLLFPFHLFPPTLPQLPQPLLFHSPPVSFHSSSPVSPVLPLPYLPPRTGSSWAFISVSEAVPSPLIGLDYLFPFLPKMVYTSFAPSLSSRDAAPFDALVASGCCLRSVADTRVSVECHRLAASLRFQSMTSRDTGLSGSIDRSNTASESNFIEPQDPTNNTAMSATTVYPATFYPPPATFNHTPSNPAHVYRRPSQPAAPIYSNQCATVPTASSFDASGHQIESESAPRNSALTQPVPTMSRYQSGAAQAPLTLRPNLAAPITHVLSQPHPRISTFSNSAPLIDPAIHLDIVRYPVTELVAMLAAKLQSLITTNDQLKRLSSSSSSSSSPRPASSSQNKQDTRLLSFHARNIPSITITAYLNRILKYCPTDPEVFISVLVYFDRIMQIANSRAEPIFGSYFAPFQVLPGRPLVHSSLPPPAHNDDTFTIDSFNVHRLVITTIAVATKFFSDQFYTNSRYARVFHFTFEPNN